MVKHIKRFATFALLVVFSGALARAQKRPFSVIEAPIPDMMRAMKEKRVTSREIVRQYLERIALYDDKLRATIAVNPNALK